MTTNTPTEAPPQKDEEEAAEPVVAQDAGPPQQTAGSRKRSTRRYWLMLLLPLVVGFGLRVGFGVMDRVPSVDETVYLGSGLNLLEGNGFTRGGRPELHFPPLVPAVLGATAELTDDAHDATVIVTIIAGTLMLLPMAGIARRAAGDRAGIVAAWVGAIAYGLAFEIPTRGGGSEGIYTLLVLCALWCAVCVAPGNWRRSLVQALGAGVAMGLAYLARPEGLWFGLVMAGIVAIGAVGGVRALLRWPGWRRAGMSAALGVVVVVTLVGFAIPYVAYLHANTGKWEFTAKTQDASIEAWRAVAEGDRRARDEILYGLDETGLDFTARRYSLLHLAREDPKGYAAIVGVNVQKLWEALFGGWRMLPLPLLLFALWTIWRERRNHVVVSACVVALVPIATVLAFFVLPRYLVVATAILLTVSAVGLAKLSRPWFIGAMALVVAMMFGAMADSTWARAGFGHPREPVEQRAAGEWIKEHTDPQDRVMARSQVVAYYADRGTVALPYADPEATINFGRHFFGARYLVADQFILWDWRPQLRYLFEDGPWPGLRLVHEDEGQGRLVRVFALDPPPARVSDDGHLPTLAHAGDGSPARDGAPKPPSTTAPPAPVAPPPTTTAPAAAASTAPPG